MAESRCPTMGVAVVTQEITTTDVIHQLAAEDLLDETQRAHADAFVESRTFAQPWYIRTMVGVGAWLASLLLIGFVGGFAIAMQGGYAFVGLAFIVAATIVRRKSDNDFLVQGTLAVSLAGQALLAWGIFDALGGDDLELFLVLSIVVSSLMFFAFPDRIHRVLMVLFIAAAATTLLYSWELNNLVPFVAPMLAIGIVLLHNRHSALLAGGYGQYVRPLTNGLVLSAFGVMLLSTVYILPELGIVDPKIYPRPWISTVIFGAILLYVANRIAADQLDSLSSSSRLVIGLLMVIVIGASWFAPGLALALIVVMLGASVGQKTLIGAGVGFFVVFLATYFYGIEVTLKTKSITLVCAGAAVLAARWVMLRLFDARVERITQNG